VPLVIEPSPAHIRAEVVDLGGKYARFICGSAKALRTAATLTESGFGDMALSLAGQIDESESVIVYSETRIR